MTIGTRFSNDNKTTVFAVTSSGRTVLLGESVEPGDKAAKREVLRQTFAIRTIRRLAREEQQEVTA